MKLFLCAACALLHMLVMGASATSSAQPAPSRERLVVSASWLRQHAADANVVLLHVGNRETYDAGHIPGARYVDYRSTLAAAQAPDGLTLEMPPADLLHDRLAALGVADTSHVIVYQSDDMWTPSTRVLLTLEYAGVAQVSWLDGGQQAWIAAGGPLTTVDAPSRVGRLSPLPLRPVVVNADFVQARSGMPGYAIVDARTAAFYDGTRTGGRAPGEHKTGHIAGAVNVPFDSFTTADLHLKPAAEIAAVFSKAGVKPGDTVIAYCHIGQQATATVFAARTLGYTAVLYDGSFEDWSRRNLPVENPSVKKDR
jgi:thiosulfate/3-mercaptopyruvate sulfurtransferase